MELFIPGQNKIAGLCGGYSASAAADGLWLHCLPIGFITGGGSIQRVFVTVA